MHTSKPNDAMLPHRKALDKLWVTVDIRLLKEFLFKGLGKPSVDQLTADIEKLKENIKVLEAIRSDINYDLEQ